MTHINLMKKESQIVKEIERIEPILQFTLFNFIFIILAEFLSNLIINFTASLYYMQHVSNVFADLQVTHKEIFSFSLIKFSIFLLIIYLVNHQLMKYVKLKINPEQYVFSFSGVLSVIFITTNFNMNQGAMKNFTDFSSVIAVLSVVIITFTGILLSLPKKPRTIRKEA